MHLTSLRLLLRRSVTIPHLAITNLCSLPHALSSSSSPCPKLTPSYAIELNIEFKSFSCKAEVLQYRLQLSPRVAAYPIHLNLEATDVNFPYSFLYQVPQVRFAKCSCMQEAWQADLLVAAAPVAQSSGSSPAVRVRSVCMQLSG